MGNWWPRRIRVAGVAVGVAVLIGMVAGMFAGVGRSLTLAGVSGAIAALALFEPAAVTGWVVWGLVMAGWGWMRQEGAREVLVVAVMAGVVGVAELLAIVAKIDVPMEPSGGGREPQRVGAAAAIAAAVSGVAMILGGVGTVSGLTAAVVGAGACMVAALALISRSRVA